MQNGLYVAASGLLMQEQRLDVIANNLANVNTTGFKKDLALFSDYRPIDNRVPQNAIQKTYYNKSINTVVKLDDIATDFAAGGVRITERPFDLALEDADSFFTVETPYGIRFTRDGSFSLNDVGELVTQEGFQVITQTGAPVIVPTNTSSVEITREGNVYIDGALTGTLEIVNFEDNRYIQKIGRNLYSAVGVLPEISENPRVHQGFLERSNVEPVMEMVRMIEASRGFEMYQKVVHTYDAMNEQAATQIARI